MKTKAGRAHIHMHTCMHKVINSGRNSSKRSIVFRNDFCEVPQFLCQLTRQSARSYHIDVKEVVTPCTSNGLFIGCALWTHLHQLCFKSLLEISCLHPHDILYCQRWHTPPQQRPRVQFTSRSSRPSSMSKCWLTMQWKTLSIVRGLEVRVRTCFRSRKHTQTVTAVLDKHYTR